MSNESDIPIENKEIATTADFTKKEAKNNYLSSVITTLLDHSQQSNH